MRAFADELRAEKIPLLYRRLEDERTAGAPPAHATHPAHPEHAVPPGRAESAPEPPPEPASAETDRVDPGSLLDGRFEEDLADIDPAELVVVHPGAWTDRERIRVAASARNLPLQELEDRHFFDTPAGFAEYMETRSTPVLEYYYRRLRRRTGILMEGRSAATGEAAPAGEPAGGAWNFDAENRKSFGRDGTAGVPEPPRYPMDALRREVTDLVEGVYGSHPGRIDLTLLPLTPREAEEQLQEFTEVRLPRFGDFQDAMSTDADFAYHSRLSVALNLKLLDPRRVVEAAEAAYRAGRAPINAVEGFVRQILGWREYVRGLYWYYMPDYAAKNALDATAPLPEFFWTGDTRMNCLRHSMRNLLNHGYAHHIQRLMVLGLFAMLYGADPYEFHSWHLEMYPDAFDWASMPNALGMSQFADGGVVGTKPYAATGKYIKRMSDYCRACPFDPGTAAGEKACPFTTLYWGFLDRHRERFSGNRRMAFQMKNLNRKSAEELAAIAERERELRRKDGRI
jgi:deoxyribodipyrimidine photolyase-related protein